MSPFLPVLGAKPSPTLVFPHCILSFHLLPLSSVLSDTTMYKVGDHTIHLDYDGTNALFLPTSTEASDAAVRSKYDVTIDADPTLPPVWSPDTLGARKLIQIAGDVTPTIHSVSASKTPDGTFGVGEAIDLEVLFTTRVFVKDSLSLPYLLVETGDDRSGDAQASAKKLLLCGVRNEGEGGDGGGNIASDGFVVALVWRSVVLVQQRTRAVAYWRSGVTRINLV